METTNEGRNERTFKNFGKKLDGFMDEFHEATERLQKEFKDKFEELKQSAEKLKNESENKERWKEVEDSLKKAGDEIGNAFRAAFKKKDPQDPTP
jgi:DNA repair ATPase RecN